jgi:hypothetical protein
VLKILVNVVLIKDTFTASATPYKYGELDYVGDRWHIDEVNANFNVILCTEVFENIPYPITTLSISN